jgi:hypothetical protein
MTPGEKIKIARAKKNMSQLKQFNEIDHLPEDTKSPLMTIINSYLRDYRTQQAYSNK